MGTDGTRDGRAATVAAAVVAMTTALCAVFLWLNRGLLYGNDYFLWGLFTAASAAYVVTGVAIVRHAPARVIGWLCFLVAGALELGLTGTQYAIYALGTSPGSLPAPGAVLVVSEVTPLLALSGVVLILDLFPTGRVVGRRWRWAVGCTIAAQALAIVQSVSSPAVITMIWSDELSHAGVSAANPFGVEALRNFTNVLAPVVPLLFVIGAIGAIASLIVRRRRAGADERRQIRWLTTVAVAAMTWILAMFPLMVLTDPEGVTGEVFWVVITPLVALGPPAAIGIGILKHRLYDIDVVIRKTVIVTVVAFTLTALYLAVLGLATLGQVSRLFVGVALLALTFNPVRRAARSIADRVAYGKRASSYEVLADFSERVADTYAADDVLPRMATILAGATAARAATVWLRLGDVLQPVATSAGRPETNGPESTPARIVGDRLPDIPGEATEVRHQGELLGALSVEMPANDPLDPARERLIRDLASQAGLVLRNVRLIEELRASRQRLVSAQDEERRRIERNLHDGVQQQLVSMNVQLSLLARTAERDPAKTGEMAAQLQGRATEALEDLRDLARGIYPPLLADKGLPAALEGQARKAALPVSVEADRVGRLSQDVEAAVYFCVLEALNNVAKYAGASAAVVRLTLDDGSLTFSVTDDGGGFDAGATSYGTGLQGMADRLDAIGGTLQIASQPGRGTIVTGRITVGDPA